MGLDITVMERKDVRCPHCGEVVNTVDIASTDSSGRAWYEFLENIGYCVPYGKRTEEKDWNCLDMVLDNEQAKQLVDYAVKKEVYNWDGGRRQIPARPGFPSGRCCKERKASCQPGPAPWCCHPAGPAWKSGSLTPSGR